MNLFETVKASVSVPEAAQRYELTVTRHSMARCPFHDDCPQASNSIRTFITASDAERKVM